MEVSIPIRSITRVSDVVQVALTKHQIGELPLPGDTGSSSRGWTGGFSVGAEVGSAGFGFARRCQTMTRMKRVAAHLARRGLRVARSSGPATPSQAGWLQPRGWRYG